MFDQKNEDKKNPYKNLDDLDIFETDIINDRTKKMEDILIYLQSFSKRFQGKAFLIYSIFLFVFGMLEFTFIYVFLLPEFYLKTDPSKSKHMFSLN